MVMIDSPDQEAPMTVIDARRTPRPDLTSEPRTVCLTFGPSPELSHLLRSAAEVLDVAGVVPGSMEPSTTAEGVWLRITCDVDPADVAALVALPALADHRVDHGPQSPAERCPSCELREYLRD
jgi:hypothetical protein